VRAIDPIAWLRAMPPFDALPQELFDAAARTVDVAFYPAGTALVRVGGEPLKHLYVVRKGAARLERGGQTLQILEEGETFGYTSLITHEATLDVTVEEDLLAYRLPDAEFQRLLADANFAGHFAVGLAERLKSTLEHSPVTTFQADLSQDVGELVRRPAVWVEAKTTVAEAARVMRAERISSVLVRTDPPAIVTDRDFRSRVLAEGRGPRTPVTEVASAPIQAVPAETPIFEAWKTLLERGVHHLAVEREGRIAGVLTANDLLRCSAQGPVSVLRGVERLAGRDSLPGYSTRVAEMVAALLSGGLETNTISGFVARLNDALVRRILQWAEADLGPPPAP
jgi:CBS domain-containing protein